ncbi:hypothetical protein MKX03_032634 [Papaver bracteatum]|nr:hypothetical protein MKX03_032634 [Papaver bracteatum]
MKEHGSASSILDRVLSFAMDVAESEMLFRKMWGMLFFKIKKLVEVDLEVEIFNGIPKTKAEVLSLEIKWAVFDQHSFSPLLNLVAYRVWNSEESSDHAVCVIKRNRHYRHTSF